MIPIERWFLTYALNALFQVPLVAFAGWLVSLVCRRFGPLTLHRIWSGTLLLSIFAPIAGSSWGSGINTHVTSAGSVRMLAAESGMLQRSSFLHDGTLSLPPAVWSALFCVFVAMLFLCAARLGVRIVRTRRLLRESCVVSLTTAQALVWQRCRSAFSVWSAEIRCSAWISGPAAIGFRRPVLLLPDGFLAEATEEELTAAMGHECAHMARQDYGCNLFYELLSLAIGWHPVTRFVKARVAETREMVCDSLVADRTLKPGPYAGALLRLASRVPARTLSTHAVGILDANILEKRIMNLKAKRVRLSRSKRLGMAAVVAVIASCGLASAVALTLHIQQTQTADSGATSAADEKVYKVGDGVSAPKLLSSVDPKFPESERKSRPAKYSGTSVLALVIEKTGAPKDVKIVKGIDADFDKAAIDAVRQYRFAPAMKDGEAVAAAVHLEVNFKKY